MDGHLGCFLVLATVNSAAVNIGVHVSFEIKVFSGYIPRSGITGSGLPWWFRHKECACSIGDPDLNQSSHTLQHLLVVDFLMVAILTNVRWCLIIVLDFPNTWQLWASIHVPFGLHICSLEKCLFRSFAIFQLGCSFCCCYSAAWAVCIFWKLNPVSHIICKYFLPIHRVHFCLQYPLLYKSFKFD